MTTDLDTLEALARAVTPGQQWFDEWGALMPGMTEYFAALSPDVTLALLARLRAAERDRDLHIAHDRQPYPTAAAYEAVCATLEWERTRLRATERVVEELSDAINFDAIPTLMIFAERNAGVRSVVAKLRDKILDANEALAAHAETLP